VVSSDFTDNVISCKITKDCLLSDHMTMEFVVKCEVMSMFMLKNDKVEKQFGYMKWNDKCMVEKYRRLMEKYSHVLDADHLCKNVNCTDASHKIDIVDEYEK